jgi:hypothetical protein
LPITIAGTTSSARPTTSCPAMGWTSTIEK